LRTHHKTLAKDMRIIIESIDPETRKKYDYDNLERIYADYQNRIVDDEAALTEIAARFADRPALILAPGMTLKSEEKRVRAFIEREKPVVVAVNFVPATYSCDCYFFVNAARYQYARDTNPDVLGQKMVITTSNIRAVGPNEKVVNFNLLAKLGWRFFDNSAIMCLRLLSKVGVHKIAFAGFDGFPESSDGTFYANRILQADLPPELKRKINDDVIAMLEDFRTCDKGRTRIEFITSSLYSTVIADRSSNLEG
jgi:4-hydroxy 2-oxovalerate aldolase